MSEIGLLLSNKLKTQKLGLSTLSLSNFKVRKLASMFLLVILCFSLVSNSASKTSTMRYETPNRMLVSDSEQWEDIVYDTKFELVDDVVYSSEDKSLTFNRDPDQMSNTSIGGAAWITNNLSQNKALRISFKVTIENDINYIGNVKYPQGFAIVLTESDYTDLIGSKGSGLGYNGISNAIAFEFDLLQNTDQNDPSYPAFSVKKNLSGNIDSSKNLCDDTSYKGLCNIKLPNFYDEDKEDYTPVKTFVIEIIGGYLSVFLDDTVLINKIAFSDTDKLLAESNVYLGFTASMYLYKSVVIADLEIKNLSYSPSTFLVSTTQSIAVGNDVLVGVELLSLAGTRLAIFDSEYDNAVVYYNGEQVNYVEKKFSYTNYYLTLTISNIQTSGKATINISWNGSILKTSHKVTITYGSENKIDIISPTYDSSTKLLSKQGVSKEDYTIVLQLTDEYGNYKPNTEIAAIADSLISIQYPNMINDSGVNIKTALISNTNTFTFTFSPTAAGEYKIFSTNFLNGVEKLVKVKTAGINFDKSFAEIKNYFTNHNTSVNSSIKLIFYFFDVFSSSLSNEELAKVEAQVTISKELDNQKTVIKTQDVTFPIDESTSGSEQYITFTPTDQGYYTFSVQVRYNSEAYNALDCDFCDFIVPSQTIDKAKVLLYSDYTDQDLLSSDLTYIDFTTADVYKTTKSDSDKYSDKYLLISLDNNSNRKLTEITFIDTSKQQIYMSSIEAADLTKYKNIKAEIKYESALSTETTALEVQINYNKGIDLLLPIDTNDNTSSTIRTNKFSTIKSYSLCLSSTDLSINISVKVRFLFFDDILNNYNTKDNLTVNDLALDGSLIELVAENKSILSNAAFGNSITVLSGNESLLWKISPIDGKNNIISKSGLISCTSNTQIQVFSDSEFTKAIELNNNSDIVFSCVDYSNNNELRDSNLYYYIKALTTKVIYVELNIGSKVDDNFTSKKKQRYVISVIPNDTVASLEFSSDFALTTKDDVITISDLYVKDDLVVKVKMLDSNKNEINSYKGFSSIKLSGFDMKSSNSDSESLSFSILETGEAVFIDKNRYYSADRNISFSIDSKTYTLNYNKKVDNTISSGVNPYISFYELELNSKITDETLSNNVYSTSETINIKLHLKDKYNNEVVLGNSISDISESELSNINVYMVNLNSNNNNIISNNLNSGSSSTSIFKFNLSGMEVSTATSLKSILVYSLKPTDFTDSVIPEGDYEIFIFKNSIHQIKSINSSLLSVNSTYNSNTNYINKLKLSFTDTFGTISLLNSNISKNNNPLLIDLYSNNIIFTVEFLNKNNNNVPVTEAVKINNDNIKSLIKIISNKSLSTDDQKAIAADSISLVSFVEIERTDYSITYKVKDSSLIEEAVTGNVDSKGNENLLDFILVVTEPYSISSYYKDSDSASNTSTYPSFYRLKIRNSSGLNKITDINSNKDVSSLKTDFNAENTMIYFNSLINPSIITSTVDSPTSFIIELLNTNYSRVLTNVVDASKVVVSLLSNDSNPIDFNYSIINGPLVNQLTVLISSENVFNKASVYIKYSDNSILKTGYQLHWANKAGIISSFKLLDNKNSLDYYSPLISFNTDLQNEVYYKIQLLDKNNNNAYLNHHVYNQIKDNLLVFKFTLNSSDSTDTTKEVISKPLRSNYDYYNGIATYFFDNKINSSNLNKIDIVSGLSSTKLTITEKTKSYLDDIFLTCDYNSSSNTLSYKLNLLDKNGEDISSNSEVISTILPKLKSSFSLVLLKKQQKTEAGNYYYKSNQELFDYYNNNNSINRSISSDDIKQRLSYSDISSITSLTNSQTVDLTSEYHNTDITVLPYFNYSLIPSYNCRFITNNLPSTTETLDLSKSVIDLKQGNNWVNFNMNSEAYTQLDLYSTFPIIRIQYKTYSGKIITSNSNNANLITEINKLSVKLTSNANSESVFTLKPLGYQTTSNVDYMRFNNNGEVFYYMTNDQRESFKKILWNFGNTKFNLTIESSNSAIKKLSNSNSELVFLRGDLLLKDSNCEEYYNDNSNSKDKSVSYINFNENFNSVFKFSVGFTNVYEIVLAANPDMSGENKSVYTCKDALIDNLSDFVSINTSKDTDSSSTITKTNIEYVIIPSDYYNRYLVFVRLPYTTTLQSTFITDNTDDDTTNDIINLNFYYNKNLHNTKAIEVTNPLLNSNINNTNNNIKVDLNLTNTSYTIDQFTYDSQFLGEFIFKFVRVNSNNEITILDLFNNNNNLKDLNIFNIYIKETSKKVMYRITYSPENKNYKVLFRINPQSSLSINTLVIESNFTLIQSASKSSEIKNEITIKSRFSKITAESLSATTITRLLDSKTLSNSNIAITSLNNNNNTNINFNLIIRNEDYTNITNSIVTDELSSLILSKLKLNFYGLNIHTKEETLIKNCLITKVTTTTNEFNADCSLDNDNNYNWFSLIHYKIFFYDNLISCSGCLLGFNSANSESYKDLNYLHSLSLNKLFGFNFFNNNKNSNFESLGLLSNVYNNASSNNQQSTSQSTMYFDLMRNNYHINFGFVANTALSLTDLSTSFTLNDGTVVSGSSVKEFILNNNGSTDQNGTKLKLFIFSLKNTAISTNNTNTIYSQFTNNSTVSAIINNNSSGTAKTLYSFNLFIKNNATETVSTTTATKFSVLSISYNSIRKLNNINSNSINSLVSESYIKCFDSENKLTSSNSITVIFPKEEDNFHYLVTGTSIKGVVKVTIYSYISYINDIKYNTTNKDLMKNNGFFLIQSTIEDNNIKIVPQLAVSFIASKAKSYSISLSEITLTNNDINNSNTKKLYSINNALDDLGNSYICDSTLLDINIQNNSAMTRLLNVSINNSNNVSIYNTTVNNVSTCVLEINQLYNSVNLVSQTLKNKKKFVITIANDKKSFSYFSSEIKIFYNNDNSNAVYNKPYVNVILKDNFGFNTNYNNSLITYSIKYYIFEINTSTGIRKRYSTSSLDDVSNIISGIDFSESLDKGEYYNKRSRSVLVFCEINGYLINTMPLFNNSNSNTAHYNNNDVVVLFRNNISYSNSTKNDEDTTEISNINVKLYQASNLINSLFSRYDLSYNSYPSTYTPTDVIDSTNKIYNDFSLIINSVDSDYYFTTNLINNYTTRVILIAEVEVTDATKTIEVLELNVIKKNSNTLFAYIPISKLNYFYNLPRNSNQLSYKVKIEFTDKTTSKIIIRVFKVILTSEETTIDYDDNVTNNSVVKSSILLSFSSFQELSKSYSLPNIDLSNSSYDNASFELVNRATNTVESVINSNVGSYTFSEMCLRIKSITQSQTESESDNSYYINNNSILNSFINVNLISTTNQTEIDNNKCTLLYSNSQYRGCIYFSIKCESKSSNSDIDLQLTYKSKTILKVSVNLDPTLPPEIVVIKNFPDSINNLDPLQSTFKLVSSASSKETFTNIDESNFKVYLDHKLCGNFVIYKQTSETEVSFNMIISNVQYTSQDSTSTNCNVNTRNPSLKIIFVENTNKMFEVESLSKEIRIVQSSPDLSLSQLVLPVYLRAGEDFNLGVVFYEKNSVCYEESFDSLLTNFKFNVSDSNGKVILANELFNFTQVSNIPDSLCKSYLKISLKDSSNNLTVVTDQAYIVNAIVSETKTLTGKLSIFPNETYADKTKVLFKQVIQEIAVVTAGDSFELEITGSDKYDNKIDFLKTGENISVSIPSLDTLGKKDNQTYYTVKVTPSSDVVLVQLYITKTGQFDISIKTNIKKDDGSYEDLDYNIGVKKIYINPDACSNKYPSITFSETKLFSGENGIATIQCQDSFGNDVDEQGKEVFSFSVRAKALDNQTIAANDEIPYTSSFENGVYKFKFLVIYSGTYTVKAYLDNKSYGTATVITVSSQSCPSDKPIMCSNRNCTDNIWDCNGDVSSVCKEDTKNPFSCNVDGELTCVSSISECDCPTGYYKCFGGCFTKDSGIACKNESAQSYCSLNTIKRRVSNIYSSELSEDVSLTTCGDNTCRVKFSSSSSSNQCFNKIACPLGFKTCGILCIPNSSDCLFTKIDSDGKTVNSCSENEVLCPDMTCVRDYSYCPTMKTCDKSTDFVCPDGLCVEDPMYCSQPPSCVDPYPYLCPDFSCKASESDCEKRKICFEGQYLCEDNTCAFKCSTASKCKSNEYQCSTGQCVTNKLLCPTVMTCPSDSVKCPNFGCANNYDECFFISAVKSLTCPLDTPYLCSDLTCKSSANQCVYNISCPINRPFKCSNNECKEKESDCPTEKQCPLSAPVLCNTGICVTAVYNCEAEASTTESSESKEDIIAKDECYSQNKVKCSNESCADSISLCPSEPSCGAGTIRCWNGACALSISECPDVASNACSKEFPYLCKDGVCAANSSSCVKDTTCPLNKPIKCYDGSCKENISLCPSYLPCGNNMKSCPDGTCVSISTSCATLVSCPSETPFKCFDNQCKSDIRDCPEPPKCHNKFLCQDGTCVDKRTDCNSIDACPSTSPVKCSKGSCVNLASECKDETNDCPMGYYKCENETCKINKSLCEELVCPPHMSYRCPEGFCVPSSKFCDTTDGCPYNLPIKALDGTCVAKKGDMINHTSIVCSDSSEVICPNGSCAVLGSCPKSNGCMTGYKRCANGKCIDEKKTCSIAICPISNPVQCLNGECKTTLTECSLTTSQSDYIDCNTIFPGQNLYMCGDGRCVPNPEFCRPLKCEDGYQRCNDGTCKVSSDSCPKTPAYCPSSRPYLCSSSEKCVVSSDDCINSSLCTHDYPTYCSDTNSCVSADVTCDTQSKISKGSYGCASGFVKCDDGRCLSNIDECYDVSLYCSVKYPVLCDNGECAANKIDCFSDANTNIDSRLLTEDTEKVTDDKAPSADWKKCYQLEESKNDSNYRKCPYSGKCMHYTKFVTDCLNGLGCPYTHPIRCNDGSCQRNKHGCTSQSSCDLLNPYKCLDGSCAQSISQCQLIQPCPAKANHRCPISSICVDDQEKCTVLDSYCPLTSPIKCSSGKCVTDKSYCTVETMTTPCDKGEFFCTAAGACVTSIVDCITVNRVTNTLLNVNYSDSSDDNVSDTNNACPVEYPVLCGDGTCQKTSSYCPYITSCNINEYRCNNGNCSVTCSDTESISYKCSNKNLTLCPDSICRKTCLPYNGCPKSLPYQCSNGYCTTDMIECIGSSMCPDAAFPFRCIDNNCVANPDDCGELIRLNNDNIDIEATISIYDDIKIDFVYDNNNVAIGHLFIPANAFVINKSSASDITKRRLEEDDSSQTTETTQSTEISQDSESTKSAETTQSTETTEATQSTETTETTQSTETTETTQSTETTESSQATGTTESSQSTETTSSTSESSSSESESGNISDEESADKSQDEEEEDKSDTEKQLINKVHKEYGKLYISTLADSLMRNVTYNESDFFSFDINNVLANSDGELDFYNSVMSPIFHITTNLDIKYENLNLTGYIIIDSNYYDEAASTLSRISKKTETNLNGTTQSTDITYYRNINSTDYCFSQLLKSSQKYNSTTGLIDEDTTDTTNGYYWYCLERKATHTQTKFKFTSLGTFAVILNPIRTYNENDTSDQTDFILQNLTVILVGLGVLIIVFALILYVFSRILRYREKYLDHKMKISNLEKQMEEIRQMGTDAPGQTLGDNLAGIVFTKNPIHKIVTLEKGSAAELENNLEDIERKCKILDSVNQNKEEEIQELEEYYKILKDEIK